MWKPTQQGQSTPNSTPEPVRPTPVQPAVEAPRATPSSSSSSASAAGEQASISKGLSIKGEITGTESLFIDGKVEGSINIPGNRVTVGKNGVVNASISAREIVPELQDLDVGQWVPMSPTPSDSTAFSVDSFEVNRWLLWRKPDSTWAWTLTELDDSRTRLVTRVHACYDWGKPASALLAILLMEFGDFAMMRRMLRGIKERAEALHRQNP